MKKIILIVLVVVLLVGALTIPAAAFGGPQGGHDKTWSDHHRQLWKAHQNEWQDYDRQWREHQNDKHWREVHVRMWHDWYQWHRDQERVLRIRIASNAHDGPRLDIDFRN
jgi:hypothetical protein